MSASEPVPSPEDDPSQPPRPGERPDWLVGAEEGAESEQTRLGRPAPEVKLHRPAPAPVEGLERGGDGLRSEAATPGLPLSARPAPAPAPETPARPKAWAAKGSSVPKLVLVPAAKPAPEAGETDGRELDPDGMDGPLAERDPVPMDAGRERKMPARVVPLEEPWWMVLGERFATDRKLQLITLSAIAVIVGLVTFWPREGRGVSIARIEKHPEAYENQVVRVHGRVEEVFPLGQGWVYDLRQGKETITVFTRGAMPERHSRVEVVGQVSTGYLDGKPRVAILQGDQP